MTEWPRTRATGTLMLIVAAVFGAITGLAIWSIARNGLDQLLQPALFLLVGPPVLMALLCGGMGWWFLHYRPILLGMDDKGITVGRQTFAWAALTAVSHRTIFMPDAAPDWIIFHRATGRPISLAASQINQQVDQVLAALDCELARHGLTRNTTPEHLLRVLGRESRWVIRP